MAEVKALHLEENIPLGGEIDPSLELDDEKLAALANRWMSEAATLYDKLKKVWDFNDQYYEGNQTKRELIPSHKCDAVVNRIFEGTETIVPIVVANPPQFIALPAQENEESQQLADSLQEILKARYEAREVDAREKIRMAVRHMIVYRLGCLKPYWDEEIDDVNVRYIRPQRIYIPEYGESAEDIPVIEKVDMTYDEIEDIFGAEALRKVKSIGVEKEDEIRNIQRKVTIWECWSADNKFVFWKYGSEILKKMSNWGFDFTGRSEERIDEGGNAVVEDVFYNHFRKPKKPYIFLSAFRFGKSSVGETDLITQSYSVQDIINTVGRQIVNNAKKMGNSAWMVDSEVMSEEEVQNRITNEEGLIIYGPGAADPGKIRRESPPPLPEYIASVYDRMNIAFDNIFGVHSTTRGERREPETLGGRILLKQADIGRGGTFVAEVERAVAELGNWFTQLMKMYYDKEKTVKIYGENGLKFVSFSRNKIEDGIEVIVKEGSTLQIDEISQRQEAVVLWQNNALDPITLYEKLKYPNPEEMAERLWRWQTGTLLPAQQALTAQQQTMTAQPQGGTQGRVEPNIAPQQEIAEAKAKLRGGI